MSSLTLRDITVTIDGRAVVERISLNVAAGEMLALIGPNGAGKTSLLKAAAQLLPHTGAALLDGIDLRALDRRQRACRLAYLSQSDQPSWPIAVADLVALGRFPHRRHWHGPSAQDRRAVQRALAQTDLLALAQRPFNQLSGGERARAQLARALAVEAEVLLADEPVPSLDPYHQLRVMHLLREHCRAGHAVIAVLHDLTLASRFCDRLALLDRGRLVAQGDVATVLTPANLQAVYGVSAMRGEYQQQAYVLPWHYHDQHDQHDQHDRHEQHEQHDRHHQGDGRQPTEPEPRDDHALRL
jgi:iron complex transport system ATP-binding protein